MKTTFQGHYVSFPANDYFVFSDILRYIKRRDPKVNSSKYKPHFPITALRKVFIDRYDKSHKNRLPYCLQLKTMGFRETDGHPISMALSYCRLSSDV